MNRPFLAIVSICFLAMTLAGCSAAREGMEGHKTAVARVDRYSLTIDRAAELLAASMRRAAPLEPALVERLVDLWIGYTLLASQIASPDSTADVDLTPLIWADEARDIIDQWYQETILARLEDPTDSVLRDSYERRRPYVRVETHQILIFIPETATQAQIDSLKRYTDAIRARAVAGEDFAQLARAYSQHTPTAAVGGRLGWADRSRLLSELEPTVFALEPGEISETVRSRLGYHIFKVTDRRDPDYESVRERYRGDLMRRQVRDLEEEYIGSLVAAARVRIIPGAVSLLQELATSPSVRQLSGVRREAELARYRGGVFTLGELADFLLSDSPAGWRYFADEDSARVHEALLQVIRNEILTSAAQERGYTVPEAKLESLQLRATQQLMQTASQSGFQRSAFLSGDDTVEAAVDRALRQPGSLLRGNPVDRVAPALRPTHTSQVYPNRYSAVIVRALELREQRRQVEASGEPTAQSESAAPEVGQ
ncbi:MAG: peptidyl-prolyl cis-trans isomerase [Gemmatimonadota bacterium]|nr:MAG: peptidyl-prolyl cis-trans isomerase [Gemmatimonadota bacterium]